MEKGVPLVIELTEPLNHSEQFITNLIKETMKRCLLLITKRTLRF